MTCSNRFTPSQPPAKGDASPLLQLQVPLNNQGKFAGVVLGEYSIDSLLRYGTPTEVLARYAVTLMDARNQVLAGTPLPPRNPATQLLPWTPKANEYEVPVSPGGQWVGAACAGLPHLAGRGG